MSWTKTRSEIALAKRRDPDADTTELQRRLKAERLEEYIRRTVDQAPPLTAEQRERIACILRTPGTNAEFLEPAKRARAMGGAHDAA